MRNRFVLLVGKVAALLLMLTCGLHGAVVLQKSTDATTGETTISVPNADDQNWSYLWSIDGHAVTDQPLEHSSQMVILPNWPTPGSRFQVVIYADGSTISSDTFALNGADSPGQGTGSSGNAGMGSSSGSTGASGNNGSTNSGGSEIAKSIVPTGSSALVNLSTRGMVKPGLPLIAGLVVNGDSPKPVLIRAVGPGLAQFGVSDALPNPKITFYQGSAAIGSDDDWDSSPSGNTVTASQAVGAFALQDGSRDSALYVVLAPGAYTAVVDTSDGVAGTALVEFYDVSAKSVQQSRFSNISSRGYASGDDAMIVGFVIGGDQPKTVLIRAMGPTLATYGVGDAMPDPKLKLVSSGNATLAENDDWGTTAGLDKVAAASSAAGASTLPRGSHDSLILTTLQPGAYTALVSTGASNSTPGEVLVEVYEVPGS